jgi:3-oxoacyl-[acyl-carrier protein] reductase
MEVAVVTGAGRGIGQAVAQRFASAGVHVVCADLDGDAAAATAESLRDQGVGATPYGGDVSRDDDCRQIAALAGRLGELRVLANVAGISPFATGIRQVDEEMWDRVMAVNVKSIFLMSRACLPYLDSSSTSPVIVNTASVHAFAAMPQSAPYAASKGAVVALTRQMALDLAPSGVRVVAVAPGAVDTPSSHLSASALGMTLDQLGFTKDYANLGWLAEPEDVAEAIYWLASKEARCVNGTTLVVDAGLLAQLPLRR